LGPTSREEEVADDKKSAGKNGWAQQTTIEGKPGGWKTFRKEGGDYLLREGGRAATRAVGGI